MRQFDLPHSFRMLLMRDENPTSAASLYVWVVGTTDPALAIDIRQPLPISDYMAVSANPGPAVLHHSSVWL